MNWSAPTSFPGSYVGRRPGQKSIMASSANRRSVTKSIPSAKLLHAGSLTAALRLSASFRAAPFRHADWPVAGGRPTPQATGVPEHAPTGSAEFEVRSAWASHPLHTMWSERCDHKDTGLGWIAAALASDAGTARKGPTAIA
jgi:hypothetical protein